MVEITACRLLLVNLLGPLAKGEAITQEGFDGDRGRDQEAEGACGSGPAQRPRSAALSLGGRQPCAGAVGGQKKAQREKLGGHGNG